jgi:hypothetical protein
MANLAIIQSRYIFEEDKEERAYWLPPGQTSEGVGCIIINYIILFLKARFDESISHWQEDEHSHSRQESTRDKLSNQGALQACNSKNSCADKA